MSENMSEKSVKKSVIASALLAALVAGCNTGGGGGSSPPREIPGTDGGRLQHVNRELVIDQSVTGLGSSDISAQAILSIGSIYLETQVGPPTVGGTSLQASDIAMNSTNMYTAYSSYDTGGVVSKVGALEHLKPVVCDDPATLLHTELCLSSQGKVDFPNADIFAATTDGTNVYAAGSTSDETDLPHLARAYRMNLNANKTPTSVAVTKTLPSYAGTGLLVKNSTLIATSGTSTDPAKTGGLTFMDPLTLATSASQTLYDARGLGAVSAGTSIFAIRGVDGANPSALVEYAATGGAPVRTINITGNTVAESHSTVTVGNTLLLASMGDQGFRVLCKATGATLHTQAAVTVAGIPAAKTVTNSVVASPGYLFVANGEAGVYIYSFNKSSVLTSNYCQGVSVSLIGRMKLDADNSDTTYVNAELSANSLKYINIPTLLGLASTKLIMVASGNKGVSLINLSDITLSLTAVDDF